MGHDGVTQKNGVRAELIGASKRPEQTVAQDRRIPAGLKWNVLRRRPVNGGVIWLDQA